MKRDRCTILHLVALGRINAAEAERLLIACDEGRAVVWAIVAGAAAFILSQAHLQELLPGIERAVHALPAAAPKFLHHALALVTDLLGGVL
jgi:hypothetical protein